MNIENVKALADVLNAKGLTAIEIGEGASRIRIERDTSGKAAQSQSAVNQDQTTKSLTEEKSISETAESTAVSDTESQSVATSQLYEVKSPLVGVYYAAPSPDAETFVSIGSKVKKGDVLCIIETMKLMNEINAEQDGEIADICIKNGEIAEYGQVLFKMF